MLTIGVDPNISFLHGVSYGTTTNFNITFPYGQPIPPDEFFQDRPLDVAYINLLATESIYYNTPVDILYLSSHPNEANSALINPTLRNAFSIRPQALDTNITYSVMVRYGVKISYTTSGPGKITFLGLVMDPGTAGGRVFGPTGNISIILPSQNTWYDIDYRCILAYSGSAWQITSHKIRYASITGGIRVWGLWAENTSSISFPNIDSVIRYPGYYTISANTQYSIFYPRVAIAPNTNLYNL